MIFGRPNLELLNFNLSVYCFQYKSRALEGKRLPRYTNMTAPYRAVNLCKIFRRISEVWESAQSPITPQFLDIIQRMVFGYFFIVSGLRDIASQEYLTGQMFCLVRVAHFVRETYSEGKSYSLFVRRSSLL